MPREDTPQPRKRRPRTPRTQTKFTLPVDATRSRYEMLIDLLRQQIDSHALKPGDPVPTVRQFINDLGVSHTTVTRALRTLVDEGILETKVGSGTRVAVPRQKKAIGLLGLSRYIDMTKSAYMMRTLSLLQQRVLETGRTLIYRHINPQELPQVTLEDQIQVDGIVLVGQIHADHTQQLLASMRRKLPMVGISCLGDGLSPNFASDDDHDSGRLIHYLASIGHKHIATLYMDLPAYYPTSMRRIKSVKKALIELGLPHGDALFIRGSVEEQIGQLLQIHPRPTVIFLASGIHRFTKLDAALRDTPLDMRHGTLAAAYDEDIWRQIASLGIEHIRIDQPLNEIVDAAFACLENMIDQAPGPITAPDSKTFASRIVHIQSNGDAAHVKV